MEVDRPEFEIEVSKVGKAIDWLASKLSVFPNGVELCLSEHNRGATDNSDDQILDIPA